MLHRETYQFDLRVIDEMDRAEYQTLARVLQKALQDCGSDTCIHLESCKSDLMMLTIEAVTAT